MENTFKDTHSVQPENNQSISIELLSKNLSKCPMKRAYPILLVYHSGTGLPIISTDDSLFAPPAAVSGAMV